MLSQSQQFLTPFPLLVVCPPLQRSQLNFPLVSGYVPEQMNYRMYHYDKFSAYCKVQEKIFEKQNYVSEPMKNKIKPKSTKKRGPI